MTELGKLFFELLKNSGLSKNAFIARAECSHGVPYQIRKQTRLRRKTANVFARALGVNVSVFEPFIGYVKSPSITNAKTNNFRKVIYGFVGLQDMAILLLSDGGMKGREIASVLALRTDEVCRRLPVAREKMLFARKIREMKIPKE